jgi:carboxyl-terminal processing protease
LLRPDEEPTMTTHHRPTFRRRPLVAALAAAALLAACGGGGGDGGGGPQACSVTDQQLWLRDYFNATYFWYALSPQPNPASFADVPSYFDALLFTGNATFPADRYSGYESTESFNRFFGDGQTLGFGVAVNGVETVANPARTLRIRYVEPQSPAAAAGLVRGDTVVSLNGQPAADVVAVDDFSALTADQVGDQLTIVVRNAAGVQRSVTLSATIFALTPVQGASVVTSSGGRKLGYVFVNNMISQALNPIDAAFTQFKAAGVQDLVLDLRYNGGGLVSTAGTLASYAAGASAAGEPFAKLLYNDKQASTNNQTFRFANLAQSLNASRVYVLAGPRTCSASEQLINGLRGVGIDVVAIGDTTCGKPVGFLPDAYCGTTYSIVNFESVNARNEGRYFDGFQATCTVADDLDHALGSPSEGLLVAAASHADSGVCPAGTGIRERPFSLRKAGAKTTEPGERSGMLGR